MRLLPALIEGSCDETSCVMSDATPACCAKYKKAPN